MTESHALETARGVEWPRRRQQIARTSPGSDLCPRSARRLCHRHLGPAGAGGGTVEEELEWLGERVELLAAAERRVTVRSVL
ncbi:hypothetical protein GUJ93_ZPchr0013g34920 [Zizania palustris]|uniref:Uncharacterized protein n=1 Tax=Zizania palustris TaxID=103762 RepID=A0A8J5WVN2_ZIZPA|nr:hypothetical protein GUJ93_ZPchr0013g34920 [Zizania palustris]